MSDNENGKASSQRTLVDEGTEFKGALSSTCPIVVMGRIEGDVSGPSLEVAESGVVSGRIKVTELRCRGELAGELEAETVQMSGRIRDQSVIRARTLEVTAMAAGAHQGSRFGDCELSIGDPPDKQAAIDEAAGLGNKVAVAPVTATIQPPTTAAGEPAPAPASEPPVPEASEGNERRRGRNSGPVKVAPEPVVEKSPH